MKYLAFGSNLNKEDLRNWCDSRDEEIPNLLNPQIKRLENYQIGFTRKSKNRGGGVADIIEYKGDYCYGIVFDVSENDLKIIDKKEWVRSDHKGAYERLYLSDNLVTYVANKQGDFFQPSDRYLNIIIEGAKNYGLPQEWIKKLESFKIVQ
jgi:gamma-glutamylcyclotransferase